MFDPFRCWQKCCSKVGFVCLIALTIGSCANPEGAQQATECREAFNKREYTQAISKCTERADIAASHLGNAGFDIINFFDSSETEINANEDEALKTLLGEEQVNGATILNLLRLSPDVIPDVSARRTAIQSAKSSLEEAITLLSPVSASELTTDEKFLEIFSTVFALQLEMLLLIDNGVATSLDPDNTDAINAQITAGLADGSISDASDLATFHSITTAADGSALPDGTIAALDGRVWEKEQNMSLLPDSFPITDAVLQVQFGSTADLGGNLSSICTSLSSEGLTSTTTSPEGRGIITLSTLAAAAVAKLSSGALGDNDFVGQIAEAQTQLEATKVVISAQCALF